MQFLLKINKKTDHWFRLDWFFLVLILLAIILWRGSNQYNRPVVVSLPDAPSVPAMQFIAASDAAFVHRVLIFWLQQFDVQAGQYVSYRDLNYDHLTHWLGAVNQLQPSSQYAMLLATRVYSRVADDKRRRIMLEHIYRQYIKDPIKNWRWLAEATITAQHKLKDHALALKYATALAENKSTKIPYWAKDIRLTILEQLGETEQVKLLIGGLIATKTVTDPNEIKFFEAMMGRVMEKESKSDK